MVAALLLLLGEVTGDTMVEPPQPHELAIPPQRFSVLKYGGESLYLHSI